MERRETKRGEVDLENAVTTETMKEKVVPPAEPEPVPEPESKSAPSEVKHVKVNLKTVVCINGTTYGPGVGVLVPADAFEVWKHALA